MLFCIPIANIHIFFQVIMNNGVRRVVCGMRCALCQPSLCCRSLSGGTSLPQGSDGWACGVGHEVCALPTAAFFDRRNEVKVVAKVGHEAIKL